MIALFSFQPLYKISSCYYKNKSRYFSYNRTRESGQGNSGSQTKKRDVGGSYSCSTGLKRHSFNGRGNGRGKRTI